MKLWTKIKRLFRKSKYDLETKQFSDAGDERNELVDQMEVARKVMAEDREALKKLAAGEAVKQDANGGWDIKEISNG